MAAARVDVDVAWSEVEVGKIVDVGTVPEDVGETELGRDDVPSDVEEVAYERCKHASVYEITTRLTEVGADICHTNSSYDIQEDMVRGLLAPTRRAELT